MSNDRRGQVTAVRPLLFGSCRRGPRSPLSPKEYERGRCRIVQTDFAAEDVLRTKARDLALVRESGKGVTIGVSSGEGTATRSHSDLRVESHDTRGGGLGRRIQYVATAATNAAAVTIPIDHGVPTASETPNAPAVPRPMVIVTLAVVAFSTQSRTVKRTV